jgi:uncharacterized protein YndB with AHSA1/START domain
MVITATKPSLTLKRRLKASPQATYNAWTDPQKIARWFGPGTYVPTKVEADPRVGGKYNFVMRAPDGEEHDVRGVYREIVQNEKLVFSWAWKSTPERESQVTVTFKPDGDGTILTLLHEHFYDEATRDRHQFGWDGSLTKLEAILA